MAVKPAVRVLQVQGFPREGGTRTWTFELLASVWTPCINCVTSFCN
jgi:hypothetical protein